MSAEALKKRGRPKKTAILEQEVTFAEESVKPKAKRTPARKRTSPVAEEVAQPLSKAKKSTEGTVLSETIAVDPDVPQQQNGGNPATKSVAKQKHIPIAQSQLLQQAGAFADQVELGTASLQEEVAARMLASLQGPVRASALRRAWEQSSQRQQAATIEELTTSEAGRSMPVATMTTSRTTAPAASSTIDRRPVMSKPSKYIPSIPAFEKKPEAPPPLRPTQLSYQELKKNPEFKILARKYTGILVGIPFLIVTSYFLYNRYQETLARRQPGSQSPVAKSGGARPRILEDDRVKISPKQSPIDTLWGKRPKHEKRILEE